MNFIKRIGTLLAVIAMAFSLSFTSKVEAATGHTFVVDQQDDGYTYLLYEMLTGDTSVNSEGKVVLSNVKWGNGVKQDTITKLYETLTSREGKPINSPGTFADWLSTQPESVFHDLLSIMGGTSSGESLQNGIRLNLGTYPVNGENVTGYGITGLKDGYYLVRNTAIPTGDGKTYSDYIVSVVNSDIVVNTKASVPSSDKSTAEKNDSTSSSIEGQKTADYDIGDSIPFTLSIILPTNYAQYSSYRLIIIDDISAGLTWNGDAKIYFGNSDTTGHPITFFDKTGETVPAEGDKSITVTSKYTGGKVMVMDYDDLKKAAGAENLKAGDRITVKYSATLNSNAAADNYGNRNSFHINYSNDPTVRTHVGSTPDTETIIFTYKTIFNKTDGNNALTGADFTLEKLIAGSGSDSVTINDKNYTGTWKDVTALNIGEDAVNPVKTGDTSSSTFTFTGIDAGVYRLSERVTPAGYNTIDPIPFVITATHHYDAGSNGLTNLTGTDGNTFTMTMDENNHAIISADVVNKKGVVLPTTGGSGTTMFYVIGSILVVGAGILLITKKRIQ